MPALPSSLTAPIWDQFSALLPPPEDTRPLGCHRPRIDDRLIFDKLVQVLVFGCAYHRIADATVSATTLRRRRDAWIALGVMDRLQAIALAAYDRMIGLALEDIAVDGGITKAPCGGEVAGRSPVDRGKQGLKRSTVVDANGIPLGTVVAPANRHDAPLLEPTLDTLADLGAVAGGHDGQPRSWVRFRPDSGAAGGPWPGRCDRPEGQAGADRRLGAVAGGAHQCLDQRV